MYRVDRRPFEINGIIEAPSSSYQDSSKFTEDKQTLERILVSEMPQGNVADRKTGLYIFQELSDAIRFCCTMTDSKIYKVRPHAETIRYHRGDMNWTELMFQFRGNETMQHQFAKLYWQKIKTFKPCWEVLVNKIQVTGIIIGDSITRTNMCREYQRVTANVEQLQFYIERLTGQ